MRISDWSSDVCSSDLIQDLLVVANPAEAGVTLSWYSTAMYLGIALAPIVGAAALGIGRLAIPLAAMLAAVLALVFVIGSRWRAQPAGACGRGEATSASPTRGARPVHGATTQGSVVRDPRSAE